MEIDIKLPEAWTELTDKELEIVFCLIARGLSAPEIKTLLLLKWNRIRVITKTNDKNWYWIKYKKSICQVSARQFQEAIAPLDFIEHVPESPVRLSKIGRYKALPADFQEVEFEKYLYCENIYQGYLHTERMDLLKELVQILYNSNKIEPKSQHCIMAFYWFASLKILLSRNFTSFFQPIEDIQDNDLLQNKSLYQKLKESMNAQIRALTGGDVTKEERVLKMDTWRALTELDAKAKEVDDMKKNSK